MIWITKFICVWINVNFDGKIRFTKKTKTTDKIIESKNCHINTSSFIIYFTDFLIVYKSISIYLKIHIQHFTPSRNHLLYLGKVSLENVFVKQRSPKLYEYLFDALAFPL